MRRRTPRPGAWTLAVLLLGCGGPREFTRCVEGDCISRSDGESDAAYLTRLQRFNTVRHFKRLRADQPVARWMTQRLARIRAGAEKAGLALPPANAKPTVDVIQTEVPLAFAERGGRIYISTGLLLTRARTCEEVTAVLAHELAHSIMAHPTARFDLFESSTTYTRELLEGKAAERRDLAKRDGRPAPASPKKTGDAGKDLFAAGDAIGASRGEVSAMLGAVALGKAIQQGYSSRTDEIAADDAALKILRATALPTHPLAEFFARSAAAVEACPDPFYTSHPDLRDRARTLLRETRRETRGAACTAADELDFAEVQRVLKFEPIVLAGPEE